MIAIMEHEVREARRLGPDVLDRYLRARQDSGHNLALALAARSFPGVNRRDERWRTTDEGRSFRCNVPNGKYQPGLARYPRDPEAFVSSMGEARAVAKRRGLDIMDEPANARNAMQDAPEDDSMCDLNAGVGT